MQRSCDWCEKTYEAKRPHSRYCSQTCGKRARRGPPAKPIEQVPVDGPGRIELKVRADLDALIAAHPMGESLAAMALALAASLDRGAGMQEASLNRELRATLDDLARTKAGDEDELDAVLSTPAVGSDVPAEVRDPEDV